MGVHTGHPSLIPAQAIKRRRRKCRLGFCFVYGVRNVTPILLGAHGVSALKFLVLNSIGASVWTVAFGSVGYGFGTTIEQVFGKLELVHHLGLYLLAIAVCVGCSGTLSGGVIKGKNDPS